MTFTWKTTLGSIPKNSTQRAGNDLHLEDVRFDGEELDRPFHP